MGMAANHDVDIRNFGDEFEIARISDMRQRDDLVDAVLLQLLHLFADFCDIFRDGDIGTGRCQFRRIVGNGADDADFLSADFEHDGRLDAVADFRGGSGHHIGGYDRELHLVEEAGKAVFAIVEFMIADGHGVELHGVQHFRFHRAFIGGVEQRSLEIVAGIQQQDIFPFRLQRVTGLVDCGQQARGAAEAFVLAFFFRRAGRVEFVDRFDTGVKIVDVKNVELVIGQSRSS
ncbi:hypothetical protein D3C86_1196700 [compost metagenome]